MFKKLKIKTTILIALFLGLALPIVLNTYYLQIKYANDLKNDLIRTQKDVLKALSASLERSIWESTKDSAKNLVYPVFNRKDIIEINIMDSKASTHSFLYFHKEYKYNNTDCTKDKDVVIIENILFKNIKLGSLLMRFSTCKINKQILQQRNSLWIIMAIQFLISFIIIFIITHIKVIKPIKKLMHVKGIWI